jgi:hypothetical protein
MVMFQMSDCVGHTVDDLGLQVLDGWYDAPICCVANDMFFVSHVIG